MSITRLNKIKELKEDVNKIKLDLNLEIDRRDSEWTWDAYIKEIERLRNISSFWAVTEFLKQYIKILEEET